MAPSNNIWLSGQIEQGDAEKVWEAIRGLDIQTPGATLAVTISSPGGSMVEGLEIGRLLNSLPSMLPVTVTSAVGTKGEVLSDPGECASACVLVYLGAQYRFLSPGSRIGVHQFSFGDESTITSPEAASVSQLLAAEVMEFLRETRVDPDMFSLMSRTFPEDIHWIDVSELTRMRAVNEWVIDQSAEYKNANGTFYLLLWQQSYWGENKLVAGCTDGKVEFVALLQPPDLAFVDAVPHEVTMVVDGEELTPRFRTVPQATERFGSAGFTLDSMQLTRAAYAKSVGARMQVPGADMFFGFEMDLTDEKLKDTILGCSR